MASNSFVMRTVAAAAAVVLPVGVALAEPVAGRPVPWQMGFQPPASPVMEQIESFHGLLLVIITLIASLVLGLLVYVMIRFNAKRNPTPSRITHNTVIEVLWTVVPVLVLVVIAIPSFRLLYYELELPDADITIKTIGHQWYWSYEYPDEGFTFDAFMVEDDSLEEGQPRLLTADNPLVVPVDAVVRLQVTADDVLHSWALPAFGVKVDAVAGRLNEIWFEANQTGTFYGQCSELCGTLHAFMPIEVHVLSKDDYAAWLVQARAEFARIDGEDARVRLARTGAR
ncbi:MAG TPA: cytochrome c oxidase subunit II [Alphaproteobacteria bacterium]